MKKTILKTGYYYEFKDIYDSLPDELPVPTDYVEIENKETRTEQQMIEGQEFLSKEEAFGLVCKIITDNKIEKYKSQIVFFKDEGGLCKVYVFFGIDGWNVNTFDFFTSFLWNAGYRSFFRRPSGTLNPETLGNLESLKLDEAIKICKQNNLEVWEVITTRKQL